MLSNFRKRLLAGESLLGTLISMPDPSVAEIMAGAGYDWLFIDSEHGAFDASHALGLLQAAGECPCVIRVPCTDDVWIKKVLDIGAAGIIAPQVNSPEQAARVISSCKYPPEGTRGIGIGRAHSYGYGFQGYLDQANDNIAVIIQAEHIDAVNNIDAITDVPGIDCILVGPYDLSASMGLIGQVGHPDVQAAIEKVRVCCESKDIPLGFFGVTPEAVKPYMEQGFNLIAVGVDVAFLGTAASEALTLLKS